MAEITAGKPDRRHFPAASTGLLAGLVASEHARADDQPSPTHPRATSGGPVEPDWSQRLTVTVGPARADLVGTDHGVPQAGVD
jgi:hypothetical protein